MRARKQTTAALLEVGIVSSLALVLGAVSVVGIGRAMGVMRRADRNQKRHPERGSIPATRHQQIAVASPR